MSAAALAPTLLFWTLTIAVLKLLDLHTKGLLAAFLDAHRITLKLFWLRFHTPRVPHALRALSRRARRPLRRFYALGAVLVAALTPLVCAALLANVALSLRALRARPVASAVSPTALDVRSSDSDLRGMPRQSFHVLLSNATAERSAVNSDTTIDAHPTTSRSLSQSLHRRGARRTLLHLRPRAAAPHKPRVAARVTLFPHLPSLTVRRADFPLLFVALLVSVLVHELGHLLCALVNDVHVAALGVFVAFLFPGAFVTLNNLKQHSSLQQLHIVCAGVWHNLVVMLLSLFIITLTPFLSLPFYTRSGALIVTDVSRNSPLRGSLSAGDVITAVADTSLSDGLSSFEAVLSRLHGESDDIPGFCVPQRLLRQNDAPCCRGSQWRAFQPSHATRCFSTPSRAVCLDAVNTALQPMCRTNHDCEPNMRCVRPRVYGNDRLIVLSVARKKYGVVRVLFDGSVVQLWRALTVSEYVPRGWQWMSGWFVSVLARLDVPVMVARLLWFVAGGCAVLAGSNMAPALFLDGQLFVGVVVSMVGKRLKWKEGVSERVETTIVYGATMVVVVNVLLSLHFMTK